MLLIWILLLPTIFLVYTFLAGLVATWLHQYLVGTSRAGEYSHDHRMCVFASFFWPLPLIALGVAYTIRFVRFLYNYPGETYKEVLSRRKIAETGKR